MKEDMTYFLEKIHQTLEPNILKVIGTAIVSLAFFLFGNLYTEALMALAMLMIFDTILGMASAYKCGEDITSRKFSRAIFKGIVYYMAISAGYFADLTVPYNFIQATMIGFIGVTEFISILENVGRLGFKTPKKLLNQLKDYQSKK